jgi:hypothetical protein
MCTNSNPYQNLVQNYLGVNANAINANATSEANDAYNNYYQTMLKNIAQESGNLELQFNTIFQHLVHAFLHPLTQKDPSEIDWENAPEQDIYSSDQLEWWTSLFASINWYKPDAHMISTQLMDFSIDNPYPNNSVYLDKTIQPFILFTQVIMDAGELEHTNDWDPYIHIELENGESINTEVGYEELEIIHNCLLQYVSEQNGSDDPVYETQPITSIKSININYEG